MWLDASCFVKASIVGVRFFDKILLRKNVSKSSVESNAAEYGIFFSDFNTDFGFWRCSYFYYGIVEFVVPNSDLGSSKGDKPPTLTPQTYQKDSERECSDAEQVFVFLSTTFKPLWY